MRRAAAAASHLDDVGRINAETGGGSINVGTAGTTSACTRAAAASSSCRRRARSTRRKAAAAVVLGLGPARGFELETGGGSIKKCGTLHRGVWNWVTPVAARDRTCGDIAGPADIETGGGSIRVASAQGPVRAETGGETHWAERRALHAPRPVQGASSPSLSHPTANTAIPYWRLPPATSPYTWRRREHQRSRVD